MKKLLLLLIVLFTVSTNYAQQDTTGVLHRVSEGIKTTTSKVDTGSLYKQIYGDVKTGLKAVAEGLKVGVEHVYIVLVKQQVVKSITWTLLIILSFISICLWFKAYKSKEVWFDGSDATGLGVVRTIQLILSSLIFVISILYINTIITGFINPEYGALEEVVDFIGRARN